MSQRTRMAIFAKQHNIPYDDMYRICQGHFDEWIIAYNGYVRFEMRHRIETGLVRPIDPEDVWGGSRWFYDCSCDDKRTVG